MLSTETIPASLKVLWKRSEVLAFQVGRKVSKHRRHIVVSAEQSQTLAYRRTAAERAVDAFVRDNTVVGLGHGPMVVYAIEVLGRRLRDGLLTGVTCLSVSDMASAEAAVQGVPLADSQQEDLQVDLTLLEADEIDCGGQRPSFITGRVPSGAIVPQPQLPQLRSLVSQSNDCIGLVGSPQMILGRLGGSLPVVIEGEDWETIAEEIDDIFIGDAEVWRRSQDESASPRGGSNPYISPDGYNILDVRFLSTLRLNGENVGYQQIAEEIMAVKGVVTHGLFLNALKAAVIADGPEAKIVERGLLFGFKDEQEG